MEWKDKNFKGERKQETIEISMASQVTSSRVLSWERERHYEGVIHKMLVVTDGGSEGGEGIQGNAEIFETVSCRW